jgi:membrane fusion protein, multidrug efflux system
VTRPFRAAYCVLRTKSVPRALVRSTRVPAVRWVSAVLVAVLTSCGTADESSGDETHPVVGARVAAAARQPFTETVSAIGTVSARAGRVAALSAPVPARIVRVAVAVGQHVAPGQPLVELDQAPFRAALQSAEAALSAAQRNNERTQRLANEGIIPRKDADQAAADFARAQTDLVTASRNAAFAVLRSPIVGVVTRLAANLGASADPAQPLVEIADPSALDVLLGVTPTEAGRIRAGNTVTLSAGQNATGEPLGVGSVADVAGTVDTTTRSVGVRVVALATRRPLRIGETVFGEIAVFTRPDAVVVPLEALVPEGDGFKVFVVDAAGTAHARPVNVGGRTQKVAEITSGLNAGERVVTYGAYGVDDGAKIAPLQPASPPAASSAKP